MFIALLTSPHPLNYKSGYLNLPTQALFALALNILCSPHCGRSASKGGSLTFETKSDITKTSLALFAFLHCAMLSDLMFEGMTKAVETFKLKKLKGVVLRAIESPGQNAM